jgi:rubrerythrin
MESKGKDALLRAIEMEKEGKQFYIESVQKVASALAKKIFEELAAAEDKHIEVITKIYDNLQTGGPLRQWVTEIGPSGKIEKVFEESLVEKAKASEDDLKALEFGLEMENKSIKYYESLAADTSDRFEKRFYLALSYEERGHALTLLDSIEYLTDPTSWMFMRGGHYLDG